MTEPTVSFAGAILAGTGAAVLSALGLEGPALFWALVGSCIGMSFAGASSKPRAALVFICVVLMCSLFGVWIADHYFSKELVSRNTFACLLAITFHPLLNGLITRLPQMLDALVRWLPGSKP